MKTLLLTAAMALGLAAIQLPATAATMVHGVPVHGVPVHNGGIHGIIIHRCHPGRRCPPHGIHGIIIHPCRPAWRCGPHGIIIHHPIGVPPHVNGLAPGHVGPVNGIPPEQQRVGGQ